MKIAKMIMVHQASANESKTDLSATSTGKTHSDWEKSEVLSFAGNIRRQHEGTRINKYFYSQNLKMVDLAKIGIRRIQGGLGDMGYKILTHEGKIAHRQYDFVHAFHKKRNTSHLMKIFKKPLFSIKSGQIRMNQGEEEDVARQVRLEISILKNLKNSKILLKVVDLILLDYNFVLVYEHGAPLCKNCLVSNQREFSFDDIKDLRKFEVEALVGLAEINSLGYAVHQIKPENLFIDAQGNYKLGNFQRFFGHGTASRAQPGSPTRLDATTDSLTYGLLLLKSICRRKRVKIRAELGRLKSTHLIEKIHRSPKLNEKDKDLLTHLLTQDLSRRLKLMNVLVHEYFQDYINVNYHLHTKIRACFGQRMKAKQKEAAKMILSSKRSAKLRVEGQRSRRGSFRGGKQLAVPGAFGTGRTSRRGFHFQKVRSSFASAVNSVRSSVCSSGRSSKGRRSAGGGFDGLINKIALNVGSLEGRKLGKGRRSSFWAAGSSGRNRDKHESSGGLIRNDSSGRETFGVKKKKKVFNFSIEDVGDDGDKNDRNSARKWAKRVQSPGLETRNLFDSDQKLDRDEQESVKGSLARGTISLNNMYSSNPRSKTLKNKRNPSRRDSPYQASRRLNHKGSGIRRYMASGYRPKARTMRSKGSNAQKGYLDGNNLHKLEDLQRREAMINKASKQRGDCSIFSRILSIFGCTS